MQVIMNEQPAIVLQSRWIFGFLAAGCLLYAYVFAEIVADLPRGMFVFVVYAFLGVGLIYTTLASTTVVTISRDEFTSSRFFGMGPSTTLKTKDICRILVRPDNFDRITRVVIEFAGGRRVQLHQYQRNFEAARVFLTQQFGEVPNEVQSKWAL